MYSNPNVTNEEKFLKLQPGDQASWQSAWNNLCNDIEKTPDALKTAAKKISDDLNQASKDVLGQVNKLKENKSTEQKTETKQESYADSVVNYGDLFTEAETDTPPAQTDEGSNKTTANAQTSTTNSNTTNGLSETQLTTMNNALTELSKVWAVNTINALANKFYRTSYNLYRDLVNAYQQSGGKFTDQQQQTQNNANNTETPQTAEEVVDSAADSSQPQGQSSNQ